MKVSLVAISIGVLLSASPAWCADKDLSKQYSVCMDKAGGKDGDMDECVSEEHARQDERLNKNYKALVAAASPAKKKKLVALQRLWIQYRDANCGIDYEPSEGGSLDRLMYRMCLLSTTASRATELTAAKP
jgi:uncharacterized protein YecT (DUF1311 family)